MVYEAWKHTVWGNRIQLIDKGDTTKPVIAGWLQRTPEVGDEVRFKMQSGKVCRYEIKKVDPQADPPDMFFANLDATGYLEEIHDTNIV